MGKKITVAKAFTFTHPDGHQQHFLVGVHKDVPEEVAGHWYTKAHLDAGDTDDAPPEAEAGKKGGGKKAAAAEAEAGKKAEQQEGEQK